jgi:hypothetical protein
MIESFKPKELTKQYLDRLEGVLKVWDTYDREWLIYELMAIATGIASVARYLAAEAEKAEV